MPMGNSHTLSQRKSDGLIVVFQLIEANETNVANHTDQPTET